MMARCCCCRCYASCRAARDAFATPLPLRDITSYATRRHTPLFMPRCRRCRQRVCRCCRHMLHGAFACFYCCCRHIFAMLRCPLRACCCCLRHHATTAGRHARATLMRYCRVPRRALSLRYDAALRRFFRQAPLMHAAALMLLFTRYVIGGARRFVVDCWRALACYRL